MKRPQRCRLRLVAVTWRDCHGEVDWKTPEDARKWGDAAIADEYVTVGYLVARTRTHVTIASTFSQGRNLCNDLSMIPAGCVKRVESLEHRGKYLRPSE